MPLITSYSGIALAGLVALLGFFSTAFFKTLGVPLSIMVAALIIGIALNRFKQESHTKGLNFCVKNILRLCIGLLGIRIELNDILALGTYKLIIIIGAMVFTLKFAFFLAPFFRMNAGFTALTGMGNAICGASATLATASVVPDYKEKARDVAFCVIMANLVSTIVMLAYPALILKFGLTDNQAALLIGGAIQDMAQVVGAGFMLSEEIGNQSVIIKLSRILLLLPFVLAISFYFTHVVEKNAEKAVVPFPYFALGFIALCVINTVFKEYAAFQTIKTYINMISTTGMLLAISALGLQTHLSQLKTIGLKAVVFYSIISTFIGVFILSAIYLAGL